MKTIEERNIDKSSWPRGPWDNELDRKQWLDEATGLPCLITRTEETGHLCGYVGVPKSHPLFEKDFYQPDVSVHGGLTYSAHCQGHICHVVEEGEDDNIWWFGFDAMHGGDLMPRMSGSRWVFGTPVYRDWSYMEREVLDLANQLNLIVPENSKNSS